MLLFDGVAARHHAKQRRAGGETDMKQTILAALCAVVLGQPVLAQSIDERIAASLQAEGYQIVTMNRTWLGRIYVIAETETLRREMVFNPATGEILRDYAVTKGPATATADNGSDGDTPSQTATVTGATETPIDALSVTGADDATRNENATIVLDPDVPAVVVVDPVIVPASE
jgi:hypothetical protein